MLPEQRGTGAGVIAYPQRGTGEAQPLSLVLLLTLRPLGLEAWDGLAEIVQPHQGGDIAYEVGDR